MGLAVAGACLGWRLRAGHDGWQVVRNGDVHKQDHRATTARSQGLGSGLSVGMVVLTL